MPPSYVTLAGGHVVAWGDDSNNQIIGAPPEGDFVEVVPGGSKQSLAIHKDRTLALWGGTSLPTAVPELSPPGVRYFGAAIGLQHIVGIREDDRSLVFNGQYFGSTLSASMAIAPPVGRFIEVAAGAAHDIAIREDGSLHTWGTATVVSIAVPDGIFIRVRARSNYILALRADRVLFGWGGVFDNPLDADLWDGWFKSRMGQHWCHAGPFIDMDAGPNQHDFKKNQGDSTQSMPHVVGLYESRTVEGWGANNSGETEMQAGPFQAVAAGSAFSLGLYESGFLHQWGRLLGSTVPKSGHYPPPRRLMPKGRFISISAAADHAVAVRDPRPRLVAGPDFRELTSPPGGHTHEMC